MLDHVAMHDALGSSADRICCGSDAAELRDCVLLLRRRVARPCCRLSRGGPCRGTRRAVLRVSVLRAGDQRWHNHPSGQSVINDASNREMNRASRSRRPSAPSTPSLNRWCQQLLLLAACSCVIAAISKADATRPWPAGDFAARWPATWSSASSPAWPPCCRCTRPRILIYFD